MTIKDKTTGAGGNRGYRMVRSKISKGKDGYGKMVTEAREKLMQKLGYDPGYNVVAAHKNFGAHHGKDQEAEWQSRSWNTAQSDFNHDGHLSVADKIKLNKYKKDKPKPKAVGITEKFNARRTKSARKG